MTALTPAERGELADRLLPVAARLVCVVHGDGDHHDITNATQHLDRHELLALIVDLAGLVNPDRRVDHALGFITWDEYGAPAEPAATGRLTIRQLAGAWDAASGLGAEMVLESERRLTGRRLYCHDGMAMSHVAQAVGVSETTVKRWRDEGGWHQAPTITQFDAGRQRKKRAA